MKADSTQPLPLSWQSEWYCECNGQFSLTVRRPPLTVHARYARLETAHAGTSPAPDVTATVAPFRAWRGSRVVVAEKPT